MDNVETQIKNLRDEFLEKLEKVKDQSSLDEIYLDLFSKKQGKVTMMIKSLKDLAIEEKKIIGPKINSIQNELKATRQWNATPYNPNN